MIAVPRILFVQDLSDDWRAALAPVADNRLLEQTWVVRDGEEALDFLHVRGGFRRRPSGMPAVILLGADLPQLRSLELIRHIRTNPALRLLPIVLITISRNAEILRRAYELGVNGIVVKNEDPAINAVQLSATLSFWALTNVPPPGCLQQPGLDREVE